MSRHVIALSSRKGGVGKTTSAVHMADTLASAGRPVTLIDADPMQHSATWVATWSQEATGTRLRQTPAELIVVSAPEATASGITRALSAAADDGIVILDLPGGAAPPQVRQRRPWYEHADVVVLPARPAVPDAREIRRTAGEVTNGDLPAAVLLTMVRPRSEVVTDEVRAALEEVITVLDAVVPSTAAIERSFGRATSAFGRQVYGDVMDELFALLGWK